MFDSSPLFIPANFFLVRTASLPIDDLFSLFKEENPTKILAEKWLEDSFFRQAVTFSSQSLSAQIRKKKINESVVLSLLKYFSRITSRGTPYGLFSCVTWGQVNQCATSNLDRSLFVKRARPDMGWLQKYIDLMIQDESQFLNFEVQKNPIIMDQNDRYFTNYFLDKTERDIASIKKNQLSSMIFAYSSSPIAIQELIHLIQKTLPHAPKDKIIDVIKLLLNQQFLWYTLYPKLTLAAPFEDLLKKVPEKYQAELHAFDQAIKTYSVMGLDQGEAFLYELTEKMSEKVTSPRLPVQVDLGIPSKQLDLSQEILEDVAKAGEVLWQLGTFKEKSLPLKNYHSKFLEKYGQYRRVSLFDLLDSNRGLGVPIYDVSSKQHSTTHVDVSPYQEWLGNALSKALRDGHNEINLEDAILERFVQDSNKKNATHSADLFFEVYADSVEEVNAGNYLIYITNFINRGGVTFGRFVDLLSPEVTEKLKKFYKQESDLDKNTLTVESFYLPQTSNAQNVAISPSFRPDKIDLLPGGISTLNLDQIYVGATLDSLYLTNVQGNVEFRVTATNAVIDMQAPDQVRFIRQVSQERTLPIEPWSWGAYSTFPYLPRVRYNKIILSPAKWRISLSLMGLKKNSSVEEIIDQLLKWFIEFDLPDYVYITQRDNRLLMNRHFKEHLKIAAAYLKKEGNILFSEKVGQEQGHWVESSQGKHCVEYVLPIIKNPVYAQKNRTIPQLCYQEYPISDRWKLPGSEWLYYKFFLPSSSHNLFLQKDLSSFSEKLVGDHLIDQWFFIRFQEEKNHHIRWRIKLSDPTSFSILFQSVYAFTQDLLEKGQIQNLSIGSYEREIERYGGIHLIESCENFFCIDSALVIELLKFESEELPIYVIGTISVLDLLHHLQFDPQTIHHFFTNMGVEKSELTGYKEWKKKIENGFENTFGSIGQKRASILKDLAAKMKNPAFHFSMTSFSLAATLIHMHCNRLCGVDKNLENKVKAFAAHSTDSYLKKMAFRS